MTRVICDMSMSLDGFVTGPNDSRENPFRDGAGDAARLDLRAATDEDRAVLQEMRDSVGAILLGVAAEVVVEKRADLDASVRRHSTCPLQRRVKIRAIEQVEGLHLLGACGERAVVHRAGSWGGELGCDHLRRGRRRLERRSIDERTGLTQLCVECRPRVDV
jgi:hypothetical protein